MAYRPILCGCGLGCGYRCQRIQCILKKERVEGIICFIAINSLLAIALYIIIYRYLENIGRVSWGCKYGNVSS